jgi:predicted acylesterase/phospholipase RssA
MASMAMPVLLPPVAVGSSGVKYFDGSYWQPNPIFIAISEARNLWNVGPQDIGLLLSIGGGDNSFRLPSPEGDVSELYCFTAYTSTKERAHKHATAVFSQAMISNGQYVRLDPGTRLKDIYPFFGSINEREGAMRLIESHTMNYLEESDTKASLAQCVRTLLDCTVEKMAFDGDLENLRQSNTSKPVGIRLIRQYLERRQVQARSEVLAAASRVIESKNQMNALDAALSSLLPIQAT